MFKTKNLEFKYFLKYEDIHILCEAVNFIKGPSGSGKSTLLKLLNRTEAFSAGDILYKDKLISEYESISLRKNVKLISQVPFLFSGTIKDNFKIFHEYCDYKVQLNDQIMNDYLSISEANLELNTCCDKLSGGEKQRVYIAICLSMESEVIMLDEPTSALDFVLAHKVLENIIQYIKTNHKTVIVISHDNTLIDKYAEHIIHLKGNIVHE